MVKPSGNIAENPFDQPLCSRGACKEPGSRLIKWGLYGVTRCGVVGGGGLERKGPMGDNQFKLSLWMRPERPEGRFFS